MCCISGEEKTGIIVPSVDANLTPSEIVVSEAFNRISLMSICFGYRLISFSPSSLFN